MTNILITMGCRKVHKNASEHRSVGDAICEEFGLEEVGDGRILTALLNSIPYKAADLDRLVEVRRGTTLVFNLAPLKQWLFPEKGGQPKGLADYQAQVVK